jgi:hypothetical protein
MTERSAPAWRASDRSIEQTNEPLPEHGTQRLGAGLRQRPSARAWPDCLIVGARPAYPISLRAEGKRAKSPISVAIVSPSSGPIPGIVSMTLFVASATASTAAR